MSDQTTNWDLPYPQLADAANIETAVKPLADRLETVFNALFGTGTLTEAAVRAALGVVIGTDVQAHDADLDALAALATTPYGRSLLEAANAAALRTLAGSVIGTDVQAHDADLDLYAAAAGPGAQLGLNDGTTVRRGKTNIATSQSRTSASYGLLTTPDRVQNIVLPTDGLICVAYQATWQEDSGNPGRAAIFLKTGGVDTQLKIADDGSANPVTQAASNNGGTASVDRVLCTTPQGLVSWKSAATAYAGDVATGQVVGMATFGGSGSGVELAGTVTGSADAVGNPGGGPCCIFADAGTYDVSVQFKGDGTHGVTVKNRRLWVWTIGF